MTSLVSGGEPLSLASTRSSYFWPAEKKESGVESLDFSKVYLVKQSFCQFL